jgi:hypothetical protein
MSSGRENTPLPIAQSVAYAISSDLMGAAGSVALLQVPCGAHGEAMIGPAPVCGLRYVNDRPACASAGAASYPRTEVIFVDVEVGRGSRRRVRTGAILYSVGLQPRFENGDLPQL